MNEFGDRIFEHPEFFRVVARCNGKPLAANVAETRKAK